MCFIVPVDHTPCAHTVAIWQHCVDAPRSVFGHKPCPHIRQHGRPIVTRKLCHNCGGPRFFARRGGIAARGSGSPVLGQVEEYKEELSEPYDSGYQSDVTHEADDEAEIDDMSLSPRQPVAPARRWREHSRQHLPNTPQSPSQNSAWRPNLKRDLSEISFISFNSSSRQPSIDHTTSNLTKEKTSSSGPELSTSQRNRLVQSLAPILGNPVPHRKSSTLLRPSAPVEPWESLQQRAAALSTQDLTPPATPPQQSPPKRPSSTLLRPAPNLHEQSFPFAFTLPKPITMIESPTPPPTSMPTPHQHAPPSRKNSTLLHPSPPDDETPSSSYFPSKTIISLPPTPQSTPTLGCYKRCPSIIHSAQSDNEWEEPLHSSQSDVEYESDNQTAGANIKSAYSSPTTPARTGRPGRASRISFHGNQLRILSN